MTRRNTRVPGHGLIDEGIPQWYAETCPEEACREVRTAKDQGLLGYGSRVWDRSAGGHARCSCGAESEHLPSQGARRRWHAAHKKEVAR